MITIARDGGTRDRVNGLAAQVTIAHADGAPTRSTVNGLGGNDTIDASALSAGHINLTLNGGDGNDTLTGSDGNDLVDRRPRQRRRVAWARATTRSSGTRATAATRSKARPAPTRCCSTAPTSTRTSTSRPTASRVRLFRDVGNVTMDLNGVEHIQFNALGGADTITVNDLTGTDVNQVAIDLASPPGSGVGDGQADTVVINGTNGDDVITIADNNGVVTVSGLASDRDHHRRRSRPISSSSTVSAATT